MSGAVTLRDAVPGDEVLLCRLVRALADYEKLAHAARATEDDFSRALFGPQPRVWALIAEAAGEPVGFAVWFYNFSTFTGRAGLYVEDVFVVPAQRGRGVGRLIFRDLARRALAADCARMDWSVLTWNEPALALYRSLGARPLDDWALRRLEGEALRQLAE